MQKICALMLAFIMLLLGYSLHVYAFESPGFYSGRLLDAETGRPIEGAVILGYWISRSPMGGGSEFFAAKETTSDEKGQFRIVPPPAVLAGILPNGRIFADEMSFIFFKAGYEHMGPSYWDSLKMDEIRSEKVRWEGLNPIISLRKLTIEERRKREDLDRGNVPKGQRNLLDQEMEKERRDAWSKQPQY